MGLSQLADTVGTVAREATLRDVAHRMLVDTVGAVIVTDAESRAIQGIVTDRDVVRAIAEGADPATATVAELLGRPVATVREGASRAEVAHEMKVHGVRRIPVVNAEGDVTAIISMDDLIVSLGQEVADLASAVRSEFRHEIARTSNRH
mgnify:CR=1 FL=1